MSTVTDIAPHRTHAQRMESLARANRIRTERSRLKRTDLVGRDSLKIASKVIADLEAPAGYDIEDFLSMRVFELLLACPGLGRVKVNKILKHARVEPSKTLGGMTPRQRWAISIQLDARQRGIPWRYTGELVAA